MGLAVQSQAQLSVPIALATPALQAGRFVCLSESFLPRQGPTQGARAAWQCFPACPSCLVTFTRGLSLGLLRRHIT